MKKSSIIFICPYFGRLPKQHMRLWLESCRMNVDLNWLILTDDRTEYDYPKNVIVKYFSFDEIKSYINNKFDFEIKIEKSYKLCDFKPAYGYVFNEFIKNYDFWGHCDISDCIFGNLRKFFTEDILKNNDKILFLGHMTLYRNTHEVNSRFKIMSSSKIEIESILGNKDNMAFDEIKPYSINQIYIENGFSLKRLDDMYVDISPMRFAFQESSYDKNYIQFYEKIKPRIFLWTSGELFDCYIDEGIVMQKEIGYVHFQKRDMVSFVNNLDSFYIVPNKFIDANEKLTVDFIQKNCKNNFFYKKFFELKYKAFIYKLKKILNRGRFFEKN